MRISRVILLTIALICLLSVFSGPLMRPIYDRVVPRAVAWRDRNGTRISKPVPVTMTGNLVHMLILNGIGVDNLAGDISLQLDKVGCVGQGIANASHDHFPRSLLINRRLSENRAAELARDMGGIKVLQEIDIRATEDVVLVLGADYLRVKEKLAGISGNTGY